LFSQSCSQAVPSALHLTTECFSFSDFFKRPLLSGGRLLSRDRYFRGSVGMEKLTLLSGNRYFREGRYFRISTVRFRLEENDNFNFRLARDQVVHLETAANLFTSWRQANNFFVVCSSFELGGVTKMPHGKQRVLFLPDPQCSPRGDFLISLYLRLVMASPLVFTASLLNRFNRQLRKCRRLICTKDLVILHYISWSFRESSPAAVTDLVHNNRSFIYETSLCQKLVCNNPPKKKFNIDTH